MPDLDLDNGADAQDMAEAFDETNREDELAAADGDDFENPDIAPDVYDVTSAQGDADDDDGVQYELDAADFSDDIDEDDFEEDEDDVLAVDGGDDASLEDDGNDDPVDIIAGRAAPSEPGLAYVADVDASTYPRDDEAEKYESTRHLSDAQLSDLGYRDDPPTQKETSAMDAKTPDQIKKAADWEERSFGGQNSEDTVQGSGASAEDVADESDPDEEDRLDEGLEETFPASDPVSAKHIT